MAKIGNKNDASLDPAPLAEPEGGYKHLIFHGVGLHVPQAWEIGEHKGDGLYGSFRVDGADRVMAHVRWWKAPKRFRIERAVVQFRRSMGRRKRGKDEPAVPVVVPTHRVKAPVELGDDTRVFVAGFADSAEREPKIVTDVLVCAHARTVGRAAIWRFCIQDKTPTFRQIDLMCRGLIVQDLNAWRDWALFDMRFQSPPGARNDRTFLKAGVCFLRFTWRKGSVGIRRFSAATAVLGSLTPDEDDLRRWCRGAFASEFFDMRYEVESEAISDRLLCLRLKGRPKRLAPLELRWVLIRHRRLPREMEVYWDREANKIVCFEILKRTEANAATIRRMIDSYHSWICDQAARPSGAAAPKRRSGKSTARLRSLRARILPTKTVQWSLNDKGLVELTYQFKRPAKLRILRLLGSQRVGPAVDTRRVELDLIGSVVWQACQGGDKRVCDLIDQLQRQLLISYREAEISVTQYVKTLGERNILALRIPPK